MLVYSLLVCLVSELNRRHEVLINSRKNKKVNVHA